MEIDKAAALIRDFGPSDFNAFGPVPQVRAPVLGANLGSLLTNLSPSLSHSPPPALILELRDRVPGLAREGAQPPSP